MSFNIKKRNFQSGKKEYYNKLTNLFGKINKEIEINRINEENNKTELQDFKELNTKIIVCDYCKLKNSKYICPKCKINYCTVDCYKNHNEECTESFYKKNVEEELKSNKMDEQDTRKFRKNLKEYYNKLEINETDDILFPEREKHLNRLLEKIEDNNFDFSCDLTPLDWKEFNAFLNGYKNNKNNFQLWKPYWLSFYTNGFQPSIDIYDSNLFINLNKQDLKDLKELEINNQSEFYTKIEDDLNEDELDDDNDLYLRDEIIKSIILKYKDIPDISRLTKIIPSPKNVNSLCYIICLVIYVFKLFNGDMVNNSEEICEYIIEISPILYDKNIYFDDSNSVFNTFFEKLSKIENFDINRTKSMIFEDITLILKNKFFIVESLLRLYEIIHFSNIKTKNIELAKHKIIYLLSYTKTIDNDLISKLISDVEDLKHKDSIENKLGNKLREISFKNN